MEKYIDVFAGRPGSGKTNYVRKEIELALRDPCSVVVLIDYKCPDEYLSNPPANFLYFDYIHAATGIGKAMDIANLGTPVFLYYDQNRYEMKPYVRDILRAAGKAGVQVSVTVQKFSQISGGDEKWFSSNCYPYIISKSRPPRAATADEVEKAAEKTKAEISEKEEAAKTESEE